MELNNLLTMIQAEVLSLFRTNHKPYLYYHNEQHTREVVKHVEELLAFYQADSRTRLVVLAAAWFHDIGHLLGKMEQHEELGVRMMRMYISDRLEEDVLLEIENCILSTKITNQPHTLPEMIVCDADTWHLGTPAFHATDPLVWQELEARTGLIIEQKEEKSLRFLEAHTFYTSYCIDLLTKGKQDNMDWLQQKIAGH